MPYAPTLARSRAVLDRILDEPELVAALGRVEPRLLVKLVDHVGLEDAGELVALLDAPQLEGIFDEDLWKSDRAGAAETFDAARFATWLEVLVDQGASLAARKLAALDEDLVTLALSRHVLVVDLDALARRMAAERDDDDRELLEKRMESALSLDLEEWLIVSRDPRSWDAIRDVLVELNEQDFTTLSRLLARCCAATESYAEEHGGLSEVLDAAESLADDVAGAREDRREEQGHVPPASATAFVRLARETPLAELVAQTEPDPITRRHFRVAPARPTLPAAATRADLAALLASLDVASTQRPRAASQPRHRARLGTGETERPIVRALADLAAEDPPLHDRRAHELAYVANVAVAAFGLRPVDAAHRALELVERGARHVGGDALAATLRARDAVYLFRVGLRVAAEAVPPTRRRAR